MPAKRTLRWRRVLFVLVAAFLLVAFWRLAGCRWSAPTPLDVVILDKTVPDRSYREHRGLWSVLDEAYVNARTNRPFSLGEDYAGFVPLDNDSWTVRDLPKRFEDLDLFYLADAYGVYTADFYGSNAEGERSSRIYGGLALADVAAFERARAAGALAVAEFNTFASPTATTARHAMADVLGVRWTGWIGRHFTNLVRGGEVPAWAVRHYEAQDGRPWNFAGPGFLLVRDDRVVVLREGEDGEIRREGCVYTPTPSGEALSPEVARAPYLYWFEIIEPLEGTERLADFHLEVTMEGARLLASHGIPTSFPAAVARQDSTGTSLYFAGDFADRDDRFVFLRSDRESLFFRRVYRPLMRTLLKLAAEHRGRPGPVRIPGVPMTVRSETPAPPYLSPPDSEPGLHRPPGW